MSIMILFLVLSVGMVVGTAIYLNKTKKQQKKIFSPTLNTKKKSKKNKNKQLSDILDIKIKDDIICLGNRYSKVLSLGNIDFNMLSENEQTATENSLIRTAKAITYPIQFFSTTEFIDTTKIIDLMKSNKTRNPKIQDYKKHLMLYLQNLMENRTISVVKNYAIISYDGLYENAEQELNGYISTFKANIATAKVECEILNEDSLYDLIYRELNKNSALAISMLKKGGEKLYVGKEQEDTKEENTETETKEKQENKQ
ncbi:MAG: hypothetical protein IKF38_05990 [Clostridia bacterium]|nr:hypothetical protein [Clostridia bacterium]